MKKHFSIFLAVTALTGCSRPFGDKPEVRACEAYIKAIIDTPATYKRASASVFDKDAGVRTVIINYDAANAFGTPIRNMQSCNFAIIDGKPDTKGYENGQGIEMQGALHKLDDATGQSDHGCCM